MVPLRWEWPRVATSFPDSWISSPAESLLHRMRPFFPLSWAPRETRCTVVLMTCDNRMMSCVQFQDLMIAPLFETSSTILSVASRPVFDGVSTSDGKAAHLALVSSGSPAWYALRRDQKMDRPVSVVSASSDRTPASELPFASSPGDHTHTAISPGSTATMPPPTPLFAGSPTR